MAAKLGRGRRGLTILGYQNGKQLHWFTGDRTVLVTSDGRLVRTVGLPANLEATELLDRDPLTEPWGRLEAASPHRLRRLVDLLPGDHYGVMITSQFQILGRQVVEIAELKFYTVSILEQCSARGLGWSFENRFWIGVENGLVWKSIQHIHPDLPPVELELLKPYAA